jgi:hypothetical protein
VRVVTAALALESLLLAMHLSGGLLLADVARLLLELVLATLIAQGEVLRELVVAVGHVDSVLYVCLVVVLVGAA